MKLSKNLGRIATTFLATAMLAGLTAVPASADKITSEGIVGGGNGTAFAENELSFDSVLWLPTGTSVPTATFTYKLNEVDSVSNETVPEYAGIEVKPSTDTVQGDNNFVSGTATFPSATPVSTVDGKEGVSKATATVNIPLNNLKFDNVGVYKYTLTQELASTSKGDFTETKIDRLVYLYVADVSANETPDYKVTGAVMVDNSAYNKEKKSDGTILNFYLLDGDPDDPEEPVKVLASNLTVTNTITGAMGNKQDEFLYTIKVTNTDSSKTYTYTITQQGESEGSPVTFNANVSVEDLKLGDGDSLKIYGLSENDTYEVTQQADEKNRGYTTKVDGEEKMVASGSLIKDPTEGKVMPATVTFENNRTTIAPTGLVMNVAPYVLLVLVAAGAGYVFLRKREED